MTLLETGNIVAQNKLLKYLIRTQNSAFFDRLSFNIRQGMDHIKLFMKVIRTQLEMATRRTKGGSAHKIQNPAIAAMNSTCTSLRFLQMFCEGHNIDVQNFCRDQDSNFISYNLVGDSIALMIAATGAIRFAIDNREMGHIPMMIQVVDTLTELIQGSCLDNQEECASNGALSAYCQILEDCKYINKEGSEDDDLVTMGGEEMTIRMVKCKIKTAAVILVNSVLEENYLHYITKNTMANLPPKVVLAEIVDTMDPESGAVVMESAASGPTAEGEEAPEGPDEIREQGLRTYCLLRMMEDRVKESVRNPGKPAPARLAVLALRENVKVWNIVAPACGAVELARNKSVYRCHFITPDFLIEIKKRMVFFKRCQESFEKIPRSNPAEKVAVMTKNIKGLVNELQHMHRLLEDKNIKTLVAYSDFVQDKPLLGMVIVLAWMILFYGDPDDPCKSQIAWCLFCIDNFLLIADEDYGVWAEIIAHLLCLCQFGITVIWFACFWVIHAPIVAVYPRRTIPKPIPSEKPPEKEYGVELEPHEIPLPPLPVRDPGESIAQRKERIIAYVKASQYYVIYTLISFIALCGGPGLHWMLTFWCKYTMPCYCERTPS